MLDKTIELMGEDGEEGVAMRVLLMSSEEYDALPKYGWDYRSFRFHYPTAYRHEDWFWFFHKTKEGVMKQVGYFIPHLRQAAQWLGEGDNPSGLLHKWRYIIEDGGLAVKDSDFE